VKNPCAANLLLLLKGLDIIGNKKLDRIYRMKQDKNAEKLRFLQPVNPVDPVKKLVPIKSTEFIQGEK